ncbi:hypothetical protein DMUE_1701 [Dictyocoela muelleri]|nr:hypothetical protein DMUE_1701 [Dictyocoela muelleri]
MTTGFPPKELFTSTSIFKNFNKPICIDKEKINKKNEVSKSKYIEKINSQNNNHNYRRGEKIYIKNQSSDKVDKLWLGPYTIVKLSKNPNNIYVKKRERVEKVAIRNTKPFCRGENVMPSDYHYKPQ